MHSSTDPEQFHEQLLQLQRALAALQQNTPGLDQQLPPSHRRALVVLHDFQSRDRAPRLHELVELLGIDKSNVTRLVQKMQQLGHARTTQDPEDRRARRITLTVRGAELARDVQEAELACAASILATIPEEVKAQTCHAVELLLDALHETIR